MKDFFLVFKHLDQFGTDGVIVKHEFSSHTAAREWINTSGEKGVTYSVKKRTRLQ